MAEKYFNLYSTTVAVGGYTAGSGVLNVAATSPITLSAGDTCALLIYRVIAGVFTPIVLLKATAVNSTTQFAAISEGSDTNALFGDIVINVLSARGMNQIKTDIGGGGGGSGVYQNQNPQPASGFTWDNQGSATATNVGTKTLGLTMPADNSSSVFHVFYQAVPGSTPYTAILGLNVNPGFSTNFSAQGLCIGDSGGKYIMIVYAVAVATFYVLSINSTTSSASVLATYGPSSSNPFPGYVHAYFKVTDDGTNLTWSFSTDEWSWIQLYQAARGAFLSSPARMGIIWYNQNASTALGFTVFSFGTNALVAN